ncbi:50S ribosomal protein L20 [Candidatus Nomurabacteria bacterium]|nr:50S ribosomal protein L20 [Candidatus Nomurabacteria bacterium]
MPRVKKGTIALKRRRKVLKAAKGFRFGRSSKEREARTALLHAGVHAFAHRRDKKNDFRRLWNIQIGAASRPLGLSYSQLIGKLKKSKIELDRKVLATLGAEHPEVLARLLKQL